MLGISRQKRGGILVGLGAVLLMAFAGWSYTSPWRAMDRLERAAATGSAAELNELVDFEAVRINLARDLTDKTVASLSLDPYSDNAQVAYQTFLEVASRVVTPEALAKASTELRKHKTGSKSGSSSGGIKLEGGYANVGRFRVEISSPAGALAKAGKIAIEFRRLGPGSWRADRLALDPGQLSFAPGNLPRR